MDPPHHLPDLAKENLPQQQAKVGLAPDRPDQAGGNPLPQAEVNLLQQAAPQQAEVDSNLRFKPKWMAWAICFSNLKLGTRHIHTITIILGFKKLTVVAMIMGLVT
ncbi:hypothetical protein EDB84DRAFT_1446128 [Lactarius hengduanensis]|nr:hypothetical protein EDB85DRAFT_1904675 [Lactarius pseudohatsudake]KAH9009741.1 hypothetical protein EDB84DRAFT_1446128 [Lactarius hengduanensis]